MREIKFRAWDNEEKSFNYFSINDLLSDWGREYALKCSFGGDCSNYIPEQFTGLYDKNRKEIYEGDVVRGPGFGAVSVYFDGGRFCLYFLGDEYWNEYADKIEIIGNIHENPELLEGRE